MRLEQNENCETGKLQPISIGGRIGEAPIKPVVLVSGRDPCFPGGHESYVRAHGLAAIMAGYEPHIFCMGSRTAVATHDFGTLHSLGTSMPKGHIFAPLFLRVLSSAVVSFLKDHSPPHLVHGFGPWGTVGTTVMCALNRQGIRATAITSAYSTQYHEALMHLRQSRLEYGLRAWLYFRFRFAWTMMVTSHLEKRAYAGASLVLVNYESVRRLLLDQFNLKVEIRRIPYASAAAFRDITLSGDSLRESSDRLNPSCVPLVVSLSRHTPRKGVDILIRALAELNERGMDFRACLIGPGDLIEGHQRLAVRLGVASKVDIPGQVDDPFKFLQRADIFVLPSLEEGSGAVSLLEAMQAGTAVVASACDGIPEDLTDGEDGLLVPPGDVPALRGAIARLLSDSALRERLSTRAYETFMRRFSASAFTNALGETYRGLGFDP